MNERGEPGVLTPPSEAAPFVPAASATAGQLAAVLAATHDLTALLAAVLPTALAATGARTGVVLIGEAAATLTPTAALPALRQLPEAVLSDLTELAAAAARAAGTLTGILEPLAGEAFAVPLERDGLVGVLVVAATPGGPPLARAGLRQLEALAGPLAVAVANVHAHEEAQRLSVTDPLTGVGNRRLLQATLASEVERAHRFGRPLSLLMLDLDHFKQVNDTYGHAFGDLVLREFAARLRSQVREVDILARAGGEEFVVVLPETPVAGAVTLAERVCRRVRDGDFTGLGRSCRLSVSIGVAGFPDHGVSAAELLRAADEALYQVKRNGRDQVGVLPGVPGAHITGTPEVAQTTQFGTQQRR